MLQNRDIIGLVGCSNGREKEREKDIKRVEELLFKRFGIGVVRATTIFETESRTPKQRAESLLNMYRNPEIKAIFDISGGDLANEILPYLDFEVIKAANKPFIGYSDLTVILNAIYAKTGICGYNYQLLHLAGNESDLQLNQFENTFLKGEKTVIPYETIRVGAKMSGEVIGGNIRCLLKLAGTEYLPNPTRKIILLEAMSGDRNKIATYLAQLDQIGYLKGANGVILGTFSEMEKLGQCEEVVEMVQGYAKRYGIFLLKTPAVGHNEDAQPFPLGQKLEF
ncbi:LD-carboxypeptidase [Listeria rustica]|uniref:LD-carboxypeptidase n=1 Tax=Listeria rustica TaxID=2713503 RepID=A0A7W1T976_9LIST|nr:LD-carboxypeptidase [Listeria rustica]MBA3927755.1 LD-carboxypeptidase [Listeria rustica]